MSHVPNFSRTAALITDPTRGPIMLTILLDAPALPAGELAYACGITPYRRRAPTFSSFSQVSQSASKRGGAITTIALLAPRSHRRWSISLRPAGRTRQA